MENLNCLKKNMQFSKKVQIQLINKIRGSKFKNIKITAKDIVLSLLSINSKVKISHPTIYQPISSLSLLQGRLNWIYECII